MSIIDNLNKAAPVVDTASGIIGGALNYVGSLEQGRINRDYGREMAARQESLQREAWSRDDTKYERLVKDLKNSGINPMLAATNTAASQSQAVSGASSAGGTAGSAPRVDPVSYSQSILNAAQAAKLSGEEDRARELFDIQKEGGFLPGQNSVMGMLSLALGKFGYGLQDVANGIKGAVDAALTYLRSNKPLIPQLFPDKSEDSDVSRQELESAVEDPVVNHPNADGHYTDLKPGEYRDKDGFIIQSNTSRTPRSNVPTRPRNNLK